MTTHGCTKHPSFNTWRWVMRRCYDPTYRQYKDYGGRGITVCERWHDPKHFIADMGVKPDGKTLDRIDNNGNYEPGNCRWATQKEQMNNSRINRLETFEGETHTLSEWADITGIPASVISWRLCEGWSIERTLETPYNFRRKMLTFKGKTQSMKEWADEIGISYDKLKQRVKAGWKTERALTER